LGDLLIVQAQCLRKQWPQFSVTESLGLETEDHQHSKEGLYSWVTKTQGRDTLALDVSRLLQLLEALLPNGAVVG
jgi:hypothetical protein